VEYGIVSEDKDKPVLDEQTLAKLLEAAYILQEHNRELRELESCREPKPEKVEAHVRTASVRNSSKTGPSKSEPTADYAPTLGQIVETQHHIQVRRLEPEAAMSLIAERVVEAARATGAAVGIVDGENVRYCAVSGNKTLPKGTTLPKNKALSSPYLKTGQVFRWAGMNSESGPEAEEWRRRGIGSVIAVPVFHDGAVAGGLEVYYSTENAFTEQDVHTCQLMAGLVTEALARAQELTSKKSLATERATMLEALEKLKPNLAALVDTAATRDMATSVEVPNKELAQSCRKCGHLILGEEQFCGQCGSPRRGEYEPPSLQSKVASMWYMQEAQKKGSAIKAPPKGDLVHAKSQENLDQLPAEIPLAPSLEEQMPELFAASGAAAEKANESTDLTELLSREPGDEFADELETPQKASEEEIASEPVALAKPASPANWSSAASALEFLEQLASSSRSSSLARIWNTRRGDIYLAIAVILVLCVMRWGIWSNHSVSATVPAVTSAGHQKSPEANLSLFERMLVQLGLAETPEAAEDKGNPSVQVWIDTRTALYYCPGADLYGKTPKGKLATQREAQLDQFQPAYRKACN